MPALAPALLVARLRQSCSPPSEFPSPQAASPLSGGATATRFALFFCMLGGYLAGGAQRATCIHPISSPPSPHPPILLLLGTGTGEMVDA